MIIGIGHKKQAGKDTAGQIIQWLTSEAYKKDKISFEEYFSKLKDKMLCTTDYFNFEIKKFADKLKDIICILIGCTRGQLEDNKFKKKELGKEWDKWLLEYVNYNRPFFKNSQEICSLYFNSKEELEKYLKEDLKIAKRSVKITKIKLTLRHMLQLLGTDIGRDILHKNIWVNALMSEYKKCNQLSYPNWIITDVRFPNEAKAIKDRGGILIKIERKTDLNDSHESEVALDCWKEWDYIIDNNGTIEELIEKLKKILIERGIIEK